MDKIPDVGRTICKKCTFFLCNFNSCQEDCEDCVIRCCMCKADCSKCYRDCANRKTVYEPVPVDFIKSKTEPL